jgi:hypothetical protein
MRKLVFIGFVLMGALVGLFSAAKADWGTRLVMMGVGALFGAPIGGLWPVLAGRGGSVWNGTRILSLEWGLRRRIWPPTTGVTKAIRHS